MTPKRSGGLRLFTGSPTSMGEGQTALALDGTVDIYRFDVLTKTIDSLWQYQLLCTIG